MNFGFVITYQFDYILRNTTGKKLAIYLPANFVRPAAADGHCICV